MLDDFFIRALLGGIGVALVAGPLGCFIIWRRMAYFGDTMAHSALLGITLALILEVNTGIGVFCVAMLVSLALLYLQDKADLPSDTILGILSHSTLALGLVAIALMSQTPIDLMGYLFGDVLAVGTDDIALIYGGGASAIVVLLFIWKPLLAGTVNEELSQAEGQKPRRARLMFLLLLAAVIAIAIKIVGILLITALLVVPAATARRFASSPEQMAVFASVIGVFAVIGGLLVSLQWDTPSGPSIVMTAVALFLASVLTPVAR